MKKLIFAWHKIIADSPSWLSRAYILTLSYMCRQFIHEKLASKIRNSVATINWPKMKLPPRMVRVGNKTLIKIIPHIGEFDIDALFHNSLSYEYSVFAWLENEMEKRYDLVIEIGANVGVYTAFFGKFVGKGALRRVIAFEPAPEAYGRLLDNLKANDSAKNVFTFPAAVADGIGWASFFEPFGHLTNGSLDPGFAAYFSESVAQILVPTIGPDFLAALVLDGERVLLKIDVEGYEPQLLGSLSGFIERNKPDLIVEVLRETEVMIGEWLELNSYQAKLFTTAGLKALPFGARSNERDWLFEHYDR